MKTVIVGAGISGLTIAEGILSNDVKQEIVVIERENSPGGLARTFHKDGFDFDIGPHRFHTFNKDVDAYLQNILADCFVQISRKSSVHMAGKYRSWPLTMASVMGLPFPVIWKSFLDLFNKPDIKEIKSFSDFIRSRYGNNLYDFFFSGYTRKFTGISAEELHVDWAQAGVNRAVIDKRVKADSLGSLVKGILLPKPVETKFYYPSHGGIQTFCDKQCERIQAAGGKILLNTSVKELSVVNNTVNGIVLENGEIIKADKVYWSAPITVLYPECDLKFINTLIANVALKSEVPQNDYQWCYFGHSDLIFSRLTIPRHFRADCVPSGRDSVIAEITCNSETDFWKDPEIIRERLIHDLTSVGAIKEEDILFIDWQRIPETYPVYTLNYKDQLASIKLPEGLTLTGRSGSFWYNNMDHSIDQALSIVKGSKFKKDFWNER